MDSEAVVAILAMGRYTLSAGSELMELAAGLGDYILVALVFLAGLGIVLHV